MYRASRPAGSERVGRIEGYDHAVLNRCLGRRCPPGASSLARSRPAAESRAFGIGPAVLDGADGPLPAGQIPARVLVTTASMTTPPQRGQRRLARDVEDGVRFRRVVLPPFDLEASGVSRSNQAETMSF